MVYSNTDNYSTYYKNSPYDLLECKRIRLAYWNSYPSLSLATLDVVYNKVLQTGAYYDSSRDSLDQPFNFNETICRAPLEFNLIFYLSSIGEVKGYTYFGKKQSVLDDSGNLVFKNLNIILDFDYSFELDTSISLDNSLSSYILLDWKGNLTDESLTDDYEFPTRDLLLSNKVDSYPRFVNNLYQLLDDSSVSIQNGLNFISHESSNIMRLSIPPIRSFIDGSIVISRYRDDLVMIQYSDTEYYIISMLSGSQLSYGDFGGLGVGTKISTITPYVAIVSSPDGTKHTYRLNLTSTGESHSQVTRKYSYLFNPYLDRMGFMMDSIDEESSDTIKDKIKSKVLYNYMKASFGGTDFQSGSLLMPSMDLVGFEGSFLRFRNTVSNKEDEVEVFRNLEGEVILSGANTNLVVNDSCILSIGMDADQFGSRIYDFYFTSNGSRWIATDKYGVLPKESENNPNLHIRLKETDYDHQLLDGFRKNPITYNKIPNIIATFGGLLFYKYNDHYYYL